MFDDPLGLILPSIVAVTYIAWGAHWLLGRVKK